MYAGFGPHEVKSVEVNRDEGCLVIRAWSDRSDLIVLELQPEHAREIASNILEALAAPQAVAVAQDANEVEV